MPHPCYQALERQEKVVLRRHPNMSGRATVGYVESVSRREGTSERKEERTRWELRIGWLTASSYVNDPQSVLQSGRT